MTREGGGGLESFEPPFEEERGLDYGSSGQEAIGWEREWGEGRWSSDPLWPVLCLWNGAPGTIASYIGHPYLLAYAQGAPLVFGKLRSCRFVFLKEQREQTEEEQKGRGAGLWSLVFFCVWSLPCFEWGGYPYLGGAPLPSGLCPGRPLLTVPSGQITKLCFGCIFFHIRLIASPISNP